MPKFAHLNNIVPTQLPNFVQDDYPTFVAFMKAYYQFLDNQKLTRNLEYLRDIDQTLDQFIGYLKNELAVLAPALSHNRLFLKNSKSLYVAKGSEQSYKCLFKLLYNKNVQIEYPGEKVLKVSDAAWTQDTSIFIKITAGNPYLLDKNYLYLTTTDSKGTHKHRVYVTKIQGVETTTDTYEFFINKNFYGDVRIGDTIDSNGVTGTIVPIITSIKVKQSGSGFKVNQVFHISNNFSTGTFAKVTRVDALGGILEIVPISFGVGFERNFTTGILGTSAIITPATPTFNSGSNEWNISLLDRLKDYVDSGLINKVTYYSDYASGTYVGEIINDFYSNNIPPNELHLSATLQCSLGAVANYPGYYNSSSSLISDDSYIQDSEYYQDFSYVLKINEKLSSYKDIVLSCLHPVGRKLYGEYIVENSFAVSYEFTASVIKLLIPQYTDSNESVDMDKDEVYRWELLKPLFDALPNLSDYVYNKHVGKNFKPEYDNGDAITITSSTEIKNVVKRFMPIYDSSDSYTPSSVTLSDATATRDIVKRLMPEYGTGDSFFLEDARVFDITWATKNETITISNPTEVKEIVKRFSPEYDSSESYTPSVITLGDSTAIKDIVKRLTPEYGTGETLTLGDVRVFDLTKPFADGLSAPTDADPVKDINKPVSDSLSAPTDADPVKDINKPVSDSLSAPTDSSVLQTSKSFVDPTNEVSDLNYFLTTKGLTDSTSDFSETLTQNFTKILADSYEIDDVISITPAIYLTDSYTILDSNSLLTTKLFSESLSAPSDSYSYIWNAVLTPTEEVINNDSGSLQVNPYSLETYFAEEYQDGKTTFT